jgi:hypothetical protein
MPRYEGNTRRERSRNHKPMHSASKGKGGDAKIKRAKQIAGEAQHPRIVKKRERREEYEPA